MTFYMVSDLGSEILEKYKNLILFFKKSNEIFGYGEINGRFNASYFFKNYTHNPLNEIFNYYKDKNPEIAGRVCYIKEDYDTGISYAIQSISKMVMTRIDEIVDRSYFFNNFDLRRIFFDSWIVETYSRMELNEDTLKDLIKQEYNQHFKYTNLLNYELFEKVQLTVMNNESEELVQVSSKVGQLIYDKIDSSKSDDRESFSKIEEYYKKTAKELALLDLLISHLDLELLYGLRDRVDIMINEWENTLDIDE